MSVVSATLRLIGRRTGRRLISLVLAPENGNQTDWRGRLP